MATIDLRQVVEQSQKLYGLARPLCKDLRTPANDAIEVISPTGHFALKLYNPASKTAPEVQWEVDLTLHLLAHGVPVARPLAGRDGRHVQTFVLDRQPRVAVLFEWAPGEKPEVEVSTYALLGQVAAQIHHAADSFTSSLPREQYTPATLIDEQLERMQTPLVESGQWQRVFDLTERLRRILTRPILDYGVCHMDLTCDNVHLHEGRLTVFDLDSAGLCWRAYEPCRVLKISKDHHSAWLEGYRSIRAFSEADELAVPACALISEIRGAVWELGLARSSRGTPLLRVQDLPGLVEEWLAWERHQINDQG